MSWVNHWSYFDILVVDGNVFEFICKICYCFFWVQVEAYFSVRYAWHESYWIWADNFSNGTRTILYRLFFYCFHDYALVVFCPSTGRSFSFVVLIIRCVSTFVTVSIIDIVYAQCDVTMWWHCSLPGRHSRTVVLPVRRLEKDWPHFCYCSFDWFCQWHDETNKIGCTILVSGS